MSGVVIHGAALESLKATEAGSFDALLCDPPYGLSFMGKAWDYDVPSVEIWREALRVLKPGAPLLAFGGTRTWHRIATAIEDAGFEIRDSIAWMYGSGFPKSHNVSKAIDAANGDERPIIGKHPNPATPRAGTFNASFGEATLTSAASAASAASSASAAWGGYGTALKPSFEPVILARKPLDGTMVENVTAHGCGPLAIDASRIGWASPDDESQTKGKNQHDDFESGARGKTNTYGAMDRPRDNYDATGRWPANVILDEAAADLLDAQAGDRPSGISVTRNGGGGRIFNNANGETKPDGGYSDSGGASRFFFCAKASTAERELGCDGLPLKSAWEMTDRGEDEVALDSPRTGAGRGGGARNHHPTLKPIALTRYLARLVLPPARSTPRRILVPFSGAGSEMIGALLAGWDEFVGIEREAEYVTIARARLKLAMENPRAFDPEVRATKEAPDDRQPSLFGKVVT